MCALLALQGITVSPGLHHCTLADADLCIAWCAGLSLPQPVSVSKRRIVTARAGSSLGPAGTQPGLPGVAMIDTLDSGDSEQSVILGGLLAAPGQQVSGTSLPVERRQQLECFCQVAAGGGACSTTDSLRVMAEHWFLYTTSNHGVLQCNAAVLGSLPKLGVSLPGLVCARRI